MYDKNGQINFGVTCNGASWIPCYQSASRVCKKQGYEILEKTGTKEHGFFTSEDTKEMIFTCK
jgi:hypothetical protein